jgi:hypothetical protein
VLSAQHGRNDLSGEERKKGLDLLPHLELGSFAIRGEGTSRSARLPMEVCHCLQFGRQLRGLTGGRLTALNRLWEANAEGIGGRE